jgi:hypothetical protein
MEVIMGANYLTDTTATAAIIPEIWSARFYEVLLAELPFNSSVDMNYEGEIQDLGDTVNISSMAEMDEAVELPEGAAGEAEAAVISGQQLLINKRPYKDAIVTKKSQLQSIEYMDQLRDKMVYAINKRIQSIIIAETAPSASAPDHQISYDSGTTLALADILEAKELLDLQDVAMMDRVSILGSAQANDLFNITGFVSRDFIPAGSPLTSGAFQTPVLGFEVKTTTVVGNTSYWFHPSYLTMAFQQQLNIEMHSLGADGVRGTRINADVLMGVKQLDSKRIVTIS